LDLPVETRDGSIGTTDLADETFKSAGQAFQRGRNLLNRPRRFVGCLDL